jgi:CheY-like chemotaxis protein
MFRGTNAPASRRVLVVEDNPDGREMLKLLLRLCGHQVEEAQDGREGVEKALAWGPEVAVLDIGLPVLDGYEVARRLKAALGGRVLLIALTAYGGPEDRRRAFQAGFDHHLTKPAEADELLWLLQSGEGEAPDLIDMQRRTAGTRERTTPVPAVAGTDSMPPQSSAAAGTRL